MKSGIISLLSLILALSVLVSDQALAGKTGSSVQDEIIVYYFHGNQRCPTCLNIEELSRAATEKVLTTKFSPIPVKFESINVDEAANEHFIEDYQLMVRSVVIARVHNSKETGWTRLDKVWQLHNDPDAFFTYFNDKADSLIKGKK